MSSKILKEADAGAGSAVAWQPANELPQRSQAQRPPTAEAGAGEDAASAQEIQAQEAFERGLREGETAARATLQAAVDRLAHSIDTLAGLRGRARKEAEGDLLLLSLAIARRILHRELSVDPEAVAGLIKASLDKIQLQEVHRVRVHPNLEAPVRRALENLHPGRNLQIVADRARLPGDVIFETQRGSLDASVETQLQEIGRGLADRLRGRG
jgi:flagellar assembly protein FliH